MIPVVEASCKREWVELIVPIEGKPNNPEIHLIRDIENLHQFYHHMATNHPGITTFMCGSSLDHPREYTQIHDVVQVCNAIRGNTVD